jgi:hypothetical protein
MVLAFVAMIALVPSTSSTGVSSAGAPPPQAADITTDKPASGDGATCPDRKEQVPGNPYSPPCFAWTGGDNGGATAKGVTPTEITVTYRDQASPDLVSILAAATPNSGLETSTADDIARTMGGLVEYFNKHFQLYGRQMKFVRFQGSGNDLVELLGGGQDKANTDANAAADDLGAFADLSAITQPYNEALAKKQVIAIGAPYLSDDYFTKYRPYAWSDSPSCTLVTNAATDFAQKALLKNPAEWAGGDLQGKPRKLAVIRPDNGEYKRCGDAGVELLQSKGFNVDIIEYQLNPVTMNDQAANVVSKLKAGNYTSVGCGCDPQFPFYLTNKAKDQGYTPEWFVMGTALTDTDEVGKLYDQSEWSHAFGASVLGPQVDRRQTAAYKAFKEVRPNEEPATTVTTLYNQALILALGIQMAGPKLTAENFEKGLFAYSQHSGEAGAWKFGPGKYTPQQDQEIIWWDPEVISAVTGKPGAYKRQGVRIGEGQVPEGQPKVFVK